MWFLIISFIIAGLFVFALVWMTQRYWDRHDLDESDFNRRRFVLWILQGLVLPVAVWMFVNAGVFARFPPLLTGFSPVKKHDLDWLLAWLRLMPFTMVVVSSYWAGATFIWFISTHLLYLQCDRRDLIGGFILWIGLFSPMAGLILYIAGPAAAGFATVILLVPVMRELLALGNPRRKVVHPVYARALERIKQGRYSAAEREVLRQLEKCDSDFNGWMLLADLYANHFNDLDEADRLIRELCRQPEINRAQMCEALNRLADWHLTLARNTAAARRALETICEAFPATHYGDAAQQRINRIFGLTSPPEEEPTPFIG